MKKLILIFILAFSGLLATQLHAQCPMCRGAVEGAMKEKGNTKGLGLNKGILYLLATPYLAGAIIVGTWYYHKKKKSA